MRKNQQNIKMIKSRWIIHILFIVFISIIIGMGSTRAYYVYAKETANDTISADSDQEINILFLSDFHSHLDSFETNIGGEDQSVGGAARIKTLIDEKKKEDSDTLVLDGGDFSMGTMYQTIFGQDACELRTLGLMGVEVTTTGNHEFDYRAEGYYDMLEAALDSGDPLPQMVLCNVDWDHMEMNDDQKLYQEAFSDYGVKDYTILEKKGMKIAVFGVFGDDAQACAPTCALSFEDRIQAAKETVEEIKSKENPDMIIALSHSGADLGEDEELAEKVNDIDVIISAHSHTLLKEPDVVGNTSIVAAGCYGEYLGEMTMEPIGDGNWTVKDYSPQLVTDDIPEDSEMLDKLAEFKNDINDLYLAQFDYQEDQVVAYNPYTFDSVDDLYDIHTEHNLGDIIADAYVYDASRADSNTDPVDVAIVPSGTIRDTYLQGDITVEDVFDSFSLGTGADGEPGYPLISVYLTGEELRTICEVDASISDSMTSARLYMSGLSFTFNPHRMMFDKVTQAVLQKADGSYEDLESDKLYHVVADLYSGQMLGAVSEKSYGILSIQPKYADGTPIEDYENCIIYDDGQEAKAWIAIAHYMSSFEENADGIPQIPEEYQNAQGRKIVDESTDIVSIFAHPGKIVLRMIGILIGAVVIVLVLILSIKRYYKKKKNSNLK